MAVILILHNDNLSFFGMIAFLKTDNFLYKSFLNSTLHICVKGFAYLYLLKYVRSIHHFNVNKTISHYRFHITCSCLSVWIFLHLCFFWTNTLSKAYATYQVKPHHQTSSADKCITSMWLIEFSKLEDQTLFCCIQKYRREQVPHRVFNLLIQKPYIFIWQISKEIKTW